MDEEVFEPIPSTDKVPSFRSLQNNPYNVPSQLSPSPMPAGPSNVVPPGPLLSQQAQRLLEEARNENRMLEETIGALKEQINLFEQEVEQQREQHRIKEANCEEELQVIFSKNLSLILSLSFSLSYFVSVSF